MASSKNRTSTTTGTGPAKHTEPAATGEPGTPERAVAQRAAAERPPRRRAHTRERLLDAADRVLVERGYAQTTIEDVCAAAGYTRGAFYSSFGSKQDLVLALFDRHSARRLNRLESLLRDATPGSARRMARKLLTIDPAERGWILLFLEFRLDAARSPQLSAKLQVHDRAVTDALALLLEQARPGTPGRDSVAVRNLASFLLAACEGVLARTAPEGPESKEALNAAVDILATMLPTLLPGLEHEDATPAP
ncbi:TetR/AcrR family transcriptional regulator [Streptomyces sp. NPDC001118]